MLLFNLGVNAVYYGITVLLLPVLVLQAERALGYDGAAPLPLRMVAVAVALGAVLLQLWCITIMQRVGGGTPSPALPPIRLIRQGPYAIVRNPLNTGEVLLLLALAGWFASPLLLLYAAAAAVAFHLFVVLWEEPTHRRRFGEEYARYERTVPRWWPRLRRTSGRTGAIPRA